MAKSEREENHEGVSDMSADPHGTVDQGRLDEIESDGSPDRHVVGGNDGGNFNAGVDPDEVDDQLKVKRVLERPTLDPEINDQNSSGEELSNVSSNHHEVEDQSKLEDVLSVVSSNHHEVEDQSKLEDVSNGSTGHHGTEEINKLDDSVAEGLEISDPTRGSSNMTTPEVVNEKEEPVEVEPNLEEVIDDVDSLDPTGGALNMIAPEVVNEEEEPVETEANLEEVIDDVDSPDPTGGVTNMITPEGVNEKEEPVETEANLEEVIDDVDSPDPTGGVTNMITPEGVNEKEEPVETEANSEEVIDDADSPQTFPSELEADEDHLNDKPQEEMENEVGDVQVHPVNGNGKLEESGQHSFAAVHSNGHDSVHGDSTEGLKEEEDESAKEVSSDHLNHHHDTGHTEVPEVHSEPSVITSDNGIEGGQGIHDSQSLRNEDSLDNHTPSDDGLREEAGTVKEDEKVAPRILADNDWPSYKTKVVKAIEAPEQSPSTDSLQYGKEQADSENGKMAEQEGVETGHEQRNGDGVKPVRSEVTQGNNLVPKLTEPSLSQNGHSGTHKGHSGAENNGKSHGHEFPDHSKQHEETEIDSGDGKSMQESPAQGNGIKTETVGRLAGSPGPLEEAPKWVNSGSFSSPAEGDTFSSVQKYWADVTSSKYLLVEGKRSPSFGRSDEIGFPSLRTGEGRRSPSPFSLSKSEEEEIQGPFSLSKSEQGEIQGPFSFSASEQEDIQSQPSLGSGKHGGTVEDKDEGRAVPIEAVVLHHESSSSSAHVDYDLEKVVHDQETHDLICPNCGSDITKRIILKKRKRTHVPENDGGLANATVTQPESLDQDQRPQNEASHNETWGCLSCLSFFVHRGSGETEAVLPPISLSGETDEVEHEGVRCLPKFFPWGSGMSEPELQKPLLGETAREERAGEISEPQPVNTGRIHEVPLDDDEEFNCFSYLQPSKGKPPAPEVSEPSEKVDTAERPEPKPVTRGRIHEVPLDDDEQVSCFSYLQRPKGHPQAVDSSPPEGPDSEAGATSMTEPLKVDSLKEIQGDDGDSQHIGAEDDEETRSSNCLPGLLPALSWGPIPVYTHTPLDLDESPGIEANSFSIPGTSQKGEQEASLEGESTEELPTSTLQVEKEHEAQTVSEKAEETGDISHELLDEEEVSIIQLLDGIGASRPRVDNAITESEEKEKCECLPIFSFRSESSSSTKIVSSATESPKENVESDTGSSTSLPTREFHPVQDPSQEASSDFLPESRPAFPWGTSSKYDLPPSPGITTSHQEITSVTKSNEEANAGSLPSALTEQPQSLQDADDKRSFHCLPELRTSFSWGPNPVSTRLPLDTDESPGQEGPKEAHAGSAPAALAEESQHQDDAEKKGSYNCLPELLPAFSWGSFPVYADPPLDTDDTTEKQQLPPVTTGNIHNVPLDHDQGLVDLKGKGIVNESDSTPGMSTEKVNDSVRPEGASHYKPSHVETESKETGDSMRPEEASHYKPSHVETESKETDDSMRPEEVSHYVPSEERDSYPGTSTEKVNDSVRPEEASQSTPSHVETESKEMATCMCLPLVLPAIQWGLIKRTTRDNGLQESLLPQVSDGDGEQPATRPVRLEDSSLIDSKQTTVPESREDAEERRSCNCLSELLPAFSWGTTPVYTRLPLDSDESPGMAGQKEVREGSAPPALTEEPRSLDDSEEKKSCNCLTGLLPAISWGPVPVYTHPPLDMGDDTERQQPPLATTGHIHDVPRNLNEGFADGKGKRVVDESDGSPGTSTEKAADSVRQGEASHYKPSHLETGLEETAGSVRPEEVSHYKPSHVETGLEETAGSVRPEEVSHYKPSHVETASIGTSDSVRPGVSHCEPSHVETESKETASCLCLRLVLPAMQWGFTKRTTYDNGLQEPLLPQGSDGGIQRPAAGTTLLDDSSVPHSKDTKGGRVPESREDAEEKRSCNCLSELLPAFSWGPTPVYTRLPLDSDESPGMEGQKEVGEGSAPPALTEEPRSLDDSEEKKSCNCLTGLLPAISWGPVPVYTHPPLDMDDDTERQQPPLATTGHIHDVPRNLNEGFADGKGKRVVDESDGSPGTSTEKAADSVRQGEASHYKPSHLETGLKETAGSARPEEVSHYKPSHVETASIGTSDSVRPGVSHCEPSHVETESKETASCMCLPLVLPAMQWGFTKRTAYDNGLQEPLLPQGSDGGIQRPAAGTALLDDSSVPHSKETKGIPEPLLLHGLEDGLPAPPSRSGTTADPVLGAVEHSQSTVDLRKGTQITESEHFHVEGTVTSNKTVTKTELGGEPPDVNVQESNYHFDIDITDGLFTSSVEKLQPKPPPTLAEISTAEIDSSTDSFGSSSVESVPQRVHDDIGAGTSGDHPVQHLQEATNGHPVDENDWATSSGTVPPPVGTVIRDTFPAEEVKAEASSQNLNCLPLSLSIPSVRWWGPSKGLGGLEEHLLDGADENQGAGKESQVKRDPDVPKATREGNGCLPSLPKLSLYDVFRDHHVAREPLQPGAEVDDIRAPLLGGAPPRTETVVNIDQNTEGAVGAAIAAARGQISRGGERPSQEYLKSIVHGGLDVTLVSLGVVAIAAGADAQTITVIAIGLANLVFGLVTHLSNVMSLYYNNRPKFLDEVGQGFVHGCLSIFSFLFFGSLSPLTYGFSFRNAANKNYKFAVMCVVALISIVVLGAANAFIKSKSAVRVISILVITGFVATLAGCETGHYISNLLEYFGFSSV